ncbi:MULTISPECIES: rhodanese-like domain-containing protein [unclassified Methylophaga]|jgi:rhodanese-related sulfurtransferase|uniref:rhodanese-like domain-containing protein n=1 Tax=unclassified Methylophaga TaxID=2629249 RepID=UPI000C93D0C6|nr:MULTISPECIES: rhodanese-like domain-containing protein [unclassified Methylophaga]MAK67882.1 sulfurtransferase [Methylophaga sp.]MAY18564.1 sulfurtransferase [Methylophaga sp.]MBN45808.1 sulfurtransferase [Methylophaga sp.]HAO25685.1 sulfurtransferase [Methylophaga sp.]HCD05594.1 sulfurtransferase [Methylophaga sp.]|tara:strand:- start:4095 stop:4421 length:327 start_codon:yes stop_codon:yes gene_type:complete
MKQMSATQLDEFLQKNAQEAILIDVREAHELANGMLENAQHMPMNSIPAHVGELEMAKESPIVLICRSGQRSAQVGQYLEQLGFSDVINLDGGMNAWAAEIDSSMKVY